MIITLAIIDFVLFTIMIILFNKYNNMLKSCSADNPYLTETSDSITKLFTLVIFCTFCLGVLILEGD